MQQVVLSEFESSGAESGIIPDSNISRVLDDSGVLTISGSGYMPGISDNQAWKVRQDYGICIKKVIIKSGIINIGSNAFQYCRELRSVTVPEDALTIDQNAFSDCINLVGIDLPNSVISIGKSAFSGCVGLININIPDDIRSIGANAFFNTAIYNNDENWENNALYIDSCLISAKNNIVKHNVKTGTGLIADKAFYDCADLESVIIPDSVKIIGESVFYYCVNLKSVTLPNTITSIGEGAFCACKSLTGLTIPAGITNIGKSAFGGSGSDWRKIHIGELNEKLTSSVINYSSYPEITATAVKKSAAVSVSYKSECISQPAKVFVVGYKDGKIIDKRITDEKEGVQTLDGVFDEIKVMVWSDFGTLAPLADSVVLADKDWQ